eukprot:c18178_g1_i1.p1 GENE.c18178_g1_i1~~c18178_g1_i1.p1  ORF type:complete len:483 (-),score=121.33 c18178_g1_i1:198-1646(-)
MGGLSKERKQKMSFLAEYIDFPFVHRLEQAMHDILGFLGVPKPWADAGDVALSLIVCFSTLSLYYIFLGARHRKTRQQLAEELGAKLLQVEELQARLDEEEPERKPAKEVRIFMDGAFDMMHYGHMNAFRQGKALGSYLVVGVNSDESITECKGSAPVMDDDERTLSVKGCKFVDEVVPNCPYIMTDEYLKWVIETYRIDFVVHGDDPCIVNGKDVYETAVKLGKYRTIPRTEGVSTTDIVGRMLLLTKDHHDHDTASKEHLVSRTRSSSTSQFSRPPSRFLTTGRMIRLFSHGYREPAKNAKIVYMDGSFDMIHAGHMEIIEKAKKLGNYLIVGLHNDTVINANLGGNFPIMTLNERVLSVLGSHHVDDVLIDAPWTISAEMIASLHISVVVNGIAGTSEGNDPARHQVPKSMGILTEIRSSRSLTVSDIISRIHANEERYRAKFEKKNKAEQEFYKEKHKNTLDKIATSPQNPPENKKRK